MHPDLWFCFTLLSRRGFSWLNFVPDGVLEYLVLAVGALMVLTPLGSGTQ